MRDKLSEIIERTDGPLGLAIIIVALVAVAGWQYTRAQLGGRAPGRPGGFGINGLAIAVLGLAIARVAWLK